MSQQFLNAVRECVTHFKALDKNLPVRIIAYPNADGIAASAILVRALIQEGRQYSLSIMPRLSEKGIKSFAEHKYGAFIFCDIGSGRYDTIAKHLADRAVFIFDHQNQEITQFHHLNPNHHGLDGSKDISCAGIAYLFAKALNPDNKKLAHLALVGALGDMQEEFTGLNAQILCDAHAQKRWEIVKGLRLFGIETKPLHRVLAECSNPVIPQVSGSESGAQAFLKELGIKPKLGTEWKRVMHLTDDELRRLVVTLDDRCKTKTSILGERYILPHEKGPYRDAREFATLLNACGKLEKPALGIGACLGDIKLKDRARQLLDKYHTELYKSLHWFDKNVNVFMRGANYVIINARNHVVPAIMGTVSSIISKTRHFADGTIILSMARRSDDTTRVSARISGENTAQVNLRSIFDSVIAHFDGDCGGHMLAAGATINTSDEASFLEQIVPTFEKLAMEEVLC